MESILRYVEWCKKNNLKPSNADNIFAYSKLCRNETA